jgi:ribosomal-protein-alanine N-acetyltransferase
MILATERLRLTPIAGGDAAALHGLWTDGDVRRYLWDGVAIPPEQTAAVVDESLRLFRSSGFGLWGARTTSEQRLVGFGGFWYFRQPPELELMYGVARPDWRRGLATEIARAIARVHARAARDGRRAGHAVFRLEHSATLARGTRTECS